MLKLPDGMQIVEAAFTLEQQADTNSSSSLNNTITVRVEDGGGGPFLTFTTDRWALDFNEIDAWCKFLKQLEDVITSESDDSETI